MMLTSLVTLQCLRLLSISRKRTSELACGDTRVVFVNSEICCDRDDAPRVYIPNRGRMYS
jgi:hypothetical protein